MERYLTVREAAEVLNVSPQTIYNWVKTGHLKAVRMGIRGRTIRISPKTISGLGAATEDPRKALTAFLTQMVEEGKDPKTVLDQLEESAERTPVPSGAA